MSAVKHMLGYGLVQVERSKVLNHHAVVCMYLVMVVVIAARLSFRRR